jgi:predicted kinase
MGKSTYAAKLAQTEKNTVITCPDQIRGQLTGSESDMSRDGFIWGKLIPEQLKLNYLDGNSTCFDATNVSIKRRAEVMKLGKVAGYTEFECHFIKPNLNLALERNKTRERKLPEEVIERFVKTFVDPSLSEGFAKIVEIKVD